MSTPQHESGPSGLLAEVSEAVEGVDLVDHHVHSVLADDFNREAFEEVITESDRAPAPGSSSFDSQVGFAIRRWCAPVLDLPPHADPTTYVARRIELGAAEVNRRLLRASGIEHSLVDTGFKGEALLDLPALAHASGRPCSEVIRLEGLAEDVVSAGEPAGRFADVVRERLAARIDAGAVGTKSIAAYRCGLAFPTDRPSDAAVTGSAGRWLKALDAGGRARADDPTLIAFLLWAGIDAGVPLQIHTGFGDTDLHLARANPLLLTDFLRATEPSGTPVVLLHCYPFHREAGYLCQMFPHAYFDVGEAVNYTGAQSRRVVAESLELAPFAKQLFSSDAWGAAELHHLGAVLWRRAMTAALTGFVAAGDWSLEDARRVATLIGAGNARRIYRLGSQH